MLSTVHWTCLSVKYSIYPTSDHQVQTEHCSSYSPYPALFFFLDCFTANTASHICLFCLPTRLLFQPPQRIEDTVPNRGTHYESITQLWTGAHSLRSLYFQTFSVKISAKKCQRDHSISVWYPKWKVFSLSLVKYD